MCGRAQVSTQRHLHFEDVRWSRRLCWMALQNPKCFPSRLVTEVWGPHASNHKTEHCDAYPWNGNLFMWKQALWERVFCIFHGFSVDSAQRRFVLLSLSGFILGPSYVFLLHNISFLVRIIWAGSVDPIWNFEYKCRHLNPSQRHFRDT